MNRTIEIQDSTNNAPSEQKLVSPTTASSTSPSHGISRIAISSNHAGKNGGNASNSSSSSLMNGNGELLFRRSPISHSHYQQNQSSAGSGIGSNNNSSASKNYYTLGSQSITNSYNSEDVSDILNSSSLDDYGNATLPLGDSLCLKVEQLQRQVESLSETQASQDERYRRTRQENEDLLNRIHSLEDQLRELEINSDNRAREDERRFKETMAKQMKLKSQECEQHLNANYLLQQDIITLQKDLMKSESQLRALRGEKEKLELELNEKNGELSALDEEVHRLKLLVKHLKDEESVKSNLINILNEELVDNHNRSQQQNQSNASFPSSNSNYSPKHQRGSNSSRRSSVTSGFGDSEHFQQGQSAQNNINSSHSSQSKVLKDIDLLEANLSKLRDENRHLKEMNEELQAQLLNVQLEEGRSLIQEGNKSYSLADEMGDIDVHKLMEALKEQQDDNARLRKYMDDILLKIVEKNPEILEKTTTTSG